MPNLLPKSIPWIDFARHRGFYINHHSMWVRHAGRLIIWWTLLFIIGLVIGYVWTKKPKPPLPATWAQTFLGAMGVWVMMALGYGTIPHEFITFGTAYLNFNTATFMLHKNRILPFDITRSIAVDVGVLGHLRHRADAPGLALRPLAEAPGLDPAAEPITDDGSASAADRSPACAGVARSASPPTADP